MNTATFYWTDELVHEYVRELIVGELGKQCGHMDIFKASKQRKPVLVTEDGVTYYSGEIKEIFATHTKEGYNSVGAYKVDSHPEFYDGLKGCYEYFFSTREAAEDFILKNKPCLSLKDVVSIIRKINDDTRGKDNRSFLTTEIVELAKYKIQKP